MQLSNSFIQFDKFEYTIEVLQGSMHIMEIFEAQAEILLIAAYIGCGEFLKAKAAYEKHRSSNRYVSNFGLQTGRIEEGLCNYDTALQLIITERCKNILA